MNHTMVREQLAEYEVVNLHLLVVLLHIWRNGRAGDSSINQLLCTKPTLVSRPAGPTVVQSGASCCLCPKATDQRSYTV